MSMLAIETIHESAHNARTVMSDELSDTALRASLAALGMLQPILVQPNGDGYTVIAGHRRLAAARALNWTHVPAVEAESVVPGAIHANTHSPLALSAAENMVRAPMHPVDTWRAIVAMVDDAGYSLTGAADALGVPHHLARRLAHLGHMAPEVVTALAAQDELPPASILRTVSLAPHDVQRKALAKAGRRNDWWAVAQACQTTRIPASRAIFDIEHSGVVFDEDLFAQPDDDERFTTTDIAGFIDNQRVTLVAEATGSKGRMTVLPWQRPMRLRDRMPKGWVATYDAVPKRWKKDDPRHVYASVVEDGYDLGGIEYVVARPKADKPAAASEAATEVVRERPDMTKITYDRLATLKRQAVIERLPVIAVKRRSTPDMLRALLLTLSFENVALYDADRRYGSAPYRDLAKRLVDADGSPIEMSEADLCVLAANTIARVVKFDGSDSTNTSGLQAEWLAKMVGAEMPRCDTAEILKGVSKDVLIALARSHGIDEKGKTSDIRARLVGHLPDWKPVDFGAKGPSGYHFDPADDDDESDGVSDNAGDDA